jgi:hypothetical protein
MKKLTLILVAVALASSVHSQLAILKQVGKNANKAKLGYGTFFDLHIPLNEYGNSNLTIELLDAAFFPPKTDDDGAALGYVSVKLGYRHIFSEESATGFYVMPMAGYCRVVIDEGPEGTHGDGIAVGAEAGYSIDVGQNGNSLAFGLKYENDMAGKDKSMSSVALRFAFLFHLFNKRN